MVARQQAILEHPMVLKEAGREEAGSKLKETRQAAARSQRLSSLGRLVWPMESEPL